MGSSIGEGPHDEARQDIFAKRALTAAECAEKTENSIEDLTNAVLGADGELIEATLKEAAHHDLDLGHILNTVATKVGEDDDELAKRVSLAVALLQQGSGGDQQIEKCASFLAQTEKLSREEILSLTQGAIVAGHWDEVDFLLSHGRGGGISSREIVTQACQILKEESKIDPQREAFLQRFAKRLSTDSGAKLQSLANLDKAVKEAFQKGVLGHFERAAQMARMQNLSFADVLQEEIKLYKSAQKPQEVMSKTIALIEPLLGRLREQPFKSLAALSQEDRAGTFQEIANAIGSNRLDTRSLAMLLSKARENAVSPLEILNQIEESSPLPSVKAEVQKAKAQVTSEKELRTFLLEKLQPLLIKQAFMEAIKSKQETLSPEFRTSLYGQEVPLLAVLKEAVESASTTEEKALAEKILQAETKALMALVESALSAGIEDRQNIDALYNAINVAKANSLPLKELLENVISRLGSNPVQQRFAIALTQKYKAFQEAPSQWHGLDGYELLRISCLAQTVIDHSTSSLQTLFIRKGQRAIERSVLVDLQKKTITILPSGKAQLIAIGTAGKVGKAVELAFDVETPKAMQVAAKKARRGHTFSAEELQLQEEFGGGVRSYKEYTSGPGTRQVYTLDLFQFDFAALAANSVPMTFDLALQIARPVGRMHEKDRVHRDLKPENWLYKDGLGQLTDFTTAYLAIAGQPIPIEYGIRRFTSPEAVLQHLDPRAAIAPTVANHKAQDSFAMGAALYELVMQEQVPWAEVTERCLRAKPGEIQPPPDFNALISSALAKLPASHPLTPYIKQFLDTSLSSRLTVTKFCDEAKSSSAKGQSGG